MKAFKFLNLLVIILVLFIFNGCAQTISLKQAAVSEEQKAVEKQIMAILTSMDEAASQLDWAKLISMADEYFAEDILIRGEDPNRKDQGIQTITLQQYRFMLRQAPAVIFDYNYKYKNRKIEIAPDGKSATVTARRVETITMERRAAVMLLAHLFKDKDMATDEPDVTIKNEEQVTMMFEYREGKLLLTQIDSKVIKTELI
ncbi:MAG: hypothetical protein ISS66_13075 [Desulfobacteraceae bacterium]|nr:hypothetical protein [Desulfobacteraceae bacterium]